MNGVHDMGGMTCFGPVEREADEPVFHAEWEKRVFALALTADLGATADEVRHAVERMDPVQYLATSYYEHWLAIVETLAVEKGVVTPEELATGTAAETTRGAGTPLSPDAVRAVVRNGLSYRRDAGRLVPRFQPGDAVRARNLHPVGHTRLPRYVRGKPGVIERVHGTFVFPDTNAHGQGEQPQPLYVVQFAAQELWGREASAHDHLCIDLWEDYLEPV